ncbi:hypothetical protein C9374_000970 [Naegleria lovaniensis]|uniref:KANL2-like probable zinc-finger domain-containing protein n=1 Tax=Naegleria lovaniensis TaxID=51637 RepID=A0AA88KLQ1_NAELO|nr:uncharacterized protein C9374_000970 [Naegleria lovaniensis]KAG2388120.1 hypothetical protein C9374_000970 [Naegleria lovaniensis]
MSEKSQASASSAQDGSTVDQQQQNNTNTTTNLCKPIGFTDDGKPIYDRTGIDILPKKPHTSAKDNRLLCAFGGSVCTQKPMKGFDFCVKHILQDPTAPFKKCEYSGKKQCGNPVKIDQEDARYCVAHKTKLGIIEKGQSGYSKKSKKQSEEAASGETQTKRGRKKASKSESDTTTSVASKEVAVSSSGQTQASTTEKPISTVEPTTSSAQPASSAASTTTPVFSSAGSATVENILPYPYENINNDEDTDSDDYTGVNRVFDPRREPKPKKTSPHKRKRKFNKKQPSSDELTGSDTESDEPTDEDGATEEYPALSFGNNSQQLSEMEFLQVRKHHIETLLKLYQKRHRKVRNELERKYNEFLIQREIAANAILEQNPNINSDIKIRLKKVNYNNYYNPKNQVNRNEDSIIVVPTVSFPAENQQIYHCEKVEKYQDDEKKVPLCCHPQCFNKRLLGVDFCLQHILYDHKQRLYVPSSTGNTPTYALNSEVNIKIPKDSTLTEKTIVVLENVDRLSAPTTWQVPPEQEQRIQNLLRKLKGHSAASSSQPVQDTITSSSNQEPTNTVTTQQEQPQQPMEMV